MQRLQFDVQRYENVIPVYLARIKDAEKANQDFFGNSGNPLRASNI
jgi:hypothetical protein